MKTLSNKAKIGLVVIALANGGGASACAITNSKSAEWTCGGKHSASAPMQRSRGILNTTTAGAVEAAAADVEPAAAAFAEVAADTANTPHQIAAPEPASMGLLGIGFVFLLIARRRFRQSSEQPDMNSG